MIKAFSAILVLVGIVLIILGVKASEAFNSQVSEVFTGNPSDRAIWLSLGGAVATIAGLAGFMRKDR
jgi:hypothetical protein